MNGSATDGIVADSSAGGGAAPIAAAESAQGQGVSFVEPATNRVATAAASSAQVVTKSAEIITSSATATISPQTRIPLPPPSHFDILPPLFALLSRLEPCLDAFSLVSASSDGHNQHAGLSGTLNGRVAGARTSGAGAGAGAGAGTGVGLGGDVNFDSLLDPPTSTGTTSTEETGTDTKKQLSYKDAPVAASFLKTRIRKTLAELKGLDDMQRTTKEQEIEIRSLETRIQRQKDMLERLGVEAGSLLSSL